MLKEIKLDNRSYQEIRDDAVANIVTHCPEWTNHNASDPGITIVELLSSMTEDIIKRLNQVPEKNYLAFLDLIGIKQRLPHPSFGQVTFSLSEGYESTEDKKSTIFIPKGSVVTTDPQGDEEVVLFETLKDLHISNVKLVNIYSKTFNHYRQRNEIVDNMKMMQEKGAFLPFSSEGASDNITQLYLGSKSFHVFQYSANVSIVFRLPTTMRLYKIKENFLESIKWEFYNGQSWQTLNILNNYSLVLDDTDADVLSVTFKGKNEDFQAWILEQFSEEENFYIRATMEETPTWLKAFSIYEIAVITSSFQEGVLPENCAHNGESLNLNNDFYPFGNRPKIDDKMIEEIFYINSDEAFEVIGTSISIKIKHSLNPEYILPRDYDNLRIVWEYPTDISQWNFLKVADNTKLLTRDGQVSFIIPDDMIKLEVNGEEGYWLRCRIADGNYGAEETTEYNTQRAEMVNTPATLRPPVFSAINISYSKPKDSLANCTVLNNFAYKDITFVDDLPSLLFTSSNVREEALILAFDSYLSEEYLSIFFDIDNDTKERNLFTQQRVLKWELLHEGQWIGLEEVEDLTDGLTASGNVKIKLPQIDGLEKNTLYIEEYQRMWIKVKVIFNSLQKAPTVNSILLNSVDVIQKETFEDELLGRSDGLPDLKFALNSKNLSEAPKVFVGEEEFKAVDRFIDYGKNDKVFRFNGIDGLIEFGDGEYGTIPELGETVRIESYSVTMGKKGNVNRHELSVLRESINYIDNVINYNKTENGEDGDTLENLKEYAPSVLKTMDRAISIEDYELLCQNFSPAIKRAKCIAKEGDVLIMPLTQTIIKDMGFINKRLLDDLRNYLQERSLLTVNPIIIPPTVIKLTVYMKLLYTVEEYNVSRQELADSILSNASKYFDPLTGFKGEGFPIGKLINKSDFYAIIQKTDNNIFIDEIDFSTNNSLKRVLKVNLEENQLVSIDTVMIEDLSYDI
jgi:hypothetical protein